MKNREKVQVFFKHALQDSKGDIILCTKGLSDGFGDFGQLKFLYQKLKTITSKKIRIIMSSGLPPKMNAAVLNLFSDIIPKINREDFLLFESEDNDTLAGLFNFLNKCARVTPNDYLILYPYTFIESNIHNSFLLEGHVLTIKEMGLTIKDILKTGDLSEGIGYGIPQWQHQNIVKINPNWLVSCKTYTGTSQKANDEKNREDMFLKFIKAGEALRISSIVFIGSENDRAVISKISKSSLLKVDCFSLLGTNELRSLMDNTVDAIFSGGEATFVESLGSNGSAASILCARYNFQYYEIAYALLQSNKMIRICKDDIIKHTEYRLFFDNKSNLIYFDDIHYYAVFNQFKETNLTHSEYLFGNKALSTLLFPIMLNSAFRSISYKTPKIFSSLKEFYDFTLETFKNLKVEKWQKENWFTIIDEAIKEE